MAVSNSVVAITHMHAPIHSRTIQIAQTRVVILKHTAVTVTTATAIATRAASNKASAAKPLTTENYNVDIVTTLVIKYAASCREL